MDQTKFEAALGEVIAQDARYARGAYYFLRDALDYTLKERKKTTGESGHVSGQLLLDGIRRFALKQFGPMVPTVFEYWGVRATVDFGCMVFALVEVDIFGKTDTDSLDDFKNIYSFHDAFVVPFLPENSVTPTNRLTVDSPAQELS
jgi:uncharacterized repeat protein (TIGR04138 family)